MSLSKQLAKQLREVHLGGNWTCVNLKDSLADVDWQMATTKMESFNTIAVLVFHINYFLGAAMQVLRGEELTAKDKYSFDHPPINSQQDWEQLLNTSWNDAAQCAQLIEQLPEEKLWEDFSDSKYGNYYRNIAGIIEHTHYHLGQIVIIKKMLATKA
jgi:hypothetical protein